MVMAWKRRRTGYAVHLQSHSHDDDAQLREMKRLVLSLSASACV